MELRAPAPRLRERRPTDDLGLLNEGNPPVGPAVIGLILGPIAEEQIRRTLAISQGDPTAFVVSPFAAGVYALPTLGVGRGRSFTPRRAGRSAGCASRGTRC